MRSLDEVAKSSLYTTKTGSATILYSYEIFLRYAVKDGSVLELGPAEGLMTERLLKQFSDVTVVEGSVEFCEILSKKFNDVEVVHTLFEDFSSSRKFDNIILGHVLEHVNDPSLVLEHIAKFLSPGGMIFCAVPNSASVHRQAAVLLGLLEAEDSMSELDIHHGHQRVFNPDSLRKVFSSVNLDIKHFGGYWLKPLSNAQLEESWTSDMLDAFMVLGERYPEIAGEIYIVAGVR